MPTQAQLLDAVCHVVHDYANLVSSGTIAVAGAHLGKQLDEPINSHVGEAFLFNCRKMFEFFTFPLPGPTSLNKDDVRAEHYLTPRLAFSLPTWAMWHDAMKKRLLHVTLSRNVDPRPWQGHKENPLFLDEFKTAWKLLRSKLPEPYQTKFTDEIASKISLNPGLNGFDLQ